MSLYADIPAVAIQVSRGVVVASVQVDLDDDILCRFRDDLLNCLHQTGSLGVILDLSGLETLDSHEFDGLRGIITMCSIMGAESVLVGLRPGVVSSLIEVGADVDGLLAATDLDSAYALLQPEPEPEPDLVPASEAGTEDAESAEDEQSPPGHPAQVNDEY
jgi:rsbT antagonist protein RsbS